MELGARHPQEFEVGCGVWPLVSHHPDPPGPAGTPFQVLPVLLWAGHLVPSASPCLFPCQRTHRALGCRPLNVAKSSTTPGIVTQPAGTQAQSLWGSQGGASTVTPPWVALNAMRL